MEEEAEEVDEEDGHIECVCVVEKLEPVWLVAGNPDASCWRFKCGSCCT